MAWTEAGSRTRIRGFLQQTPGLKGSLPNYQGGDLRVFQRGLRKQAPTNAPAGAGPLDRLSPSTAVVVDAVHVYVQLLGFDAELLENARETEASHARALSFLHFYYSVLDRIVEEGGGLRIDFHQARMHFIVAEPVGRNATVERVNRALAIVQALEDAAAIAPAQLGISIARAPLRVGMDEGMCIAIANDSGHEMDSVFLGTPANLAAKLADGNLPGIYLSHRVRHQLALNQLSDLDELKQHSVPTNIRSRIKVSSEPITRRAIDAWVQQAKASAADAKPPAFVFKRATPPLSDVRFRELSPSNSIRMDMATLFADIDQFTAYVDRQMQAGDPADVVRTMFVLREEQRAVLKDDCGAKRLRFIGDCVVGLISEGTASQTDSSKTVAQATLCAAALHGSMKVCREEIPSAESLGLQVGVAYGPTPLTRLGMRGDRSVRCAASRAISDAETQQRIALAGETSFAASALEASSRVSKIVESKRNSTRAEYAALGPLLTGAPIAIPKSSASGLAGYVSPPAAGGER